MVAVEISEKNPITHVKMGNFLVRHLLLGALFYLTCPPSPLSLLSFKNITSAITHYLSL